MKQACFKGTFFVTGHEHLGAGPFLTMPGDPLFAIRGVTQASVMRRASKAGTD